MGLRGSAPEPTAPTLHRGNPVKRPLSQSEPQPLLLSPGCTAQLDALVKKEWRRLAKILTRMRVLTRADGVALASLDQAWRTMMKAQQRLNEAGM